MLQVSLFEPFEILRFSDQESSRKDNQNDGCGRDWEVGLPKTDANPNT